MKKLELQTLKYILAQRLISEDYADEFQDFSDCRNLEDLNLSLREHYGMFRFMGIHCKSGGVRCFALTVEKLVNPAQSDSTAHTVEKPGPYPEVSLKTIWNFRQNHPELVVRDLKEHLQLDEEQCDLVRKVLLARGINKWLKVRRDLIAFKKQLKHRLKAVDAERANHPKRSPRHRELTAELKVLMETRGILKSLCMTNRWQIWPREISKGLKKMNTLRASD